MEIEQADNGDILYNFVTGNITDHDFYNFISRHFFFKSIDF